MAFKMFSAGLLLAFAGTCLCHPAGSSPSQYQPSAVSQASFQTGSTAVQHPQIKLEDVERDSLATAYGHKTQQQPGKPSATVPAIVQQQQQQQQPAYHAIAPQQQFYVQPFQAQQQQFYVQPFQAQQQYLAQPYQSLFDYPALQYLVNSNAYNPGNQVYQQYYVPAAQPSPVPQYVTKQSSPAAQTQAQQQNSGQAQVPQEYKQQFAAPAQAQQEYKQQQFAAPGQAQQEYKQQFATPVQAQQEYKQQFAAPVQAQQEYKQQFAAPVQTQQEYRPQFAAPVQAQQQYIIPTPAFQYVQQPAAAASPVDFSYVTRHPSGNAAVNLKVAPTANQPQLQYSEVPQQYYQPQNYYAVPSAGAAVAATVEQPRIQQSAKSQFSSGVKSTTPFPSKESFAYKYESSPPQQQQSGAAYSTIKYSV